MILAIFKQLGNIAGQAVYSLWWLSLTKDIQIEQLLCWSGMTDTEHSTTSSSNEEEGNIASTNAY